MVSPESNSEVIPDRVRSEDSFGTGFLLRLLIVALFVAGALLWIYAETTVSDDTEQAIALRHASAIEAVRLTHESRFFSSQVREQINNYSLDRRRMLERRKDRILEHLRALDRLAEKYPPLKDKAVSQIVERLEGINREVVLLSVSANERTNVLQQDLDTFISAILSLEARLSGEDNLATSDHLQAHADLTKLIRIVVGFFLLAGCLALFEIFRVLRLRRDLETRVSRREAELDAVLQQKEYERHQVEKALNNSEARFAEYAESSSDWFWKYDSEFRFTDISSRFFEIVRLSPSEIIERALRDVEMLRNLGTKEKWQRHYQRLELHQPFRDFEFEVQGRDGKPRWISMSGVPTFSEEGDFLGYRGTGADVTANRQRDEELKQLNRTLESRVIERTRALEAEKERAEHASYAKSEFLANMSHELRTPLNAINGFSQIMKDEMFGKQGNPLYVDYARDINSASEHLLSLITDILDVSKVESGEFELEESIVDIQPVIAACQRLISEKARNKSIAIRVDLDPLLTRIHADERILKQILINLLSNAVKFTDNNGRINIKSEKNLMGGLTLSISDNGSGIEDKDLDRVLEPFGQVRPSSEIAHEGTGLGLPLAKRFMEMHGGVLTIKSQPEIGTTVVIDFPAERSIGGQGSE